MGKMESDGITTLFRDAKSFDELSMKTSQKSNLETVEFIYIIDE